MRKLIILLFCGVCAAQTVNPNTQIARVKVKYVDPASATNLITQANALFTGCSLNCEVHIPAGTYTVTSGTISMTRNTQKLTGDGSGLVTINYAGTKFLDAHEDSTHFSSVEAGEISGFTLIESNSAAVGLSLGSWIGLEVRDVNLIGPGGFSNLGSPGTSQGIVFQNSTVTQANWFERAILRKVDIQGYSKNKHFMAPTNAGTNSFGYMSVISNTNNVGPGTLMDVVDSGANVYNALQWTEQVNSVSTTTADEYYHIAGEFRGEGFHVTGENTSAPYTFAHVLSGGHMVWRGDFHTFGSPPITVDVNQSAGSELPFNIVTPSGSFYKTGGIPLLSNYDGSGHNFSVVPLDFPDQDANISARVGYLYDTTNGNSSIYDSFTNGTKRCFFLRASTSNESALSSVWCLDGAGNVVQLGSLTNTVTNSTTQINTPLWTAQNPIVQGLNTTGNIFSVQDNFGATKMFGDHSGTWHAADFQLSSGFLSCSVGTAGLIQYQHFGGSTPDIMTGCVDTTGGGSYSAVSMLGGGSSFITSLTTTGSSGAATVTSGVLNIPVYSGGSSPLTTKGDLFGFSTVGARVPVGTNGQVLTADSTNANGVSYQTVTGTGTVTTSGSPATNTLAKFCGPLVICNSGWTDNGASSTYTGTGPSSLLYVVNGASPATTASAAGWGINTTLTTAGYYMMPDAPATGIWHATNAAGIVTDTLSPVSLTADVSGNLPHANIAATAVTPGSYTSANITVAADGSITAAANGSGGGAVSSISNSDSTLTVTPTTGAVVASLNLAHANTFTAAQSAPQWITNGSTAGFVMYGQGSTSSGTGQCGVLANSYCEQGAPSYSASFVETRASPATGFTLRTLSGSALTDAILPGVGSTGSVVLANSETVASSATPTFSINFGTSYNVLTATVTSFTLAAGVDGQTKRLCFKQGSGSYTVTPPSNVHGFFSVGLTNALYNCQELVYNLTNSIWLATSTGVINQ